MSIETDVRKSWKMFSLLAGRRVRRSSCPAGSEPGLPTTRCWKVRTSVCSAARRAVTDLSLSARKSGRSRAAGGNITPAQPSASSLAHAATTETPTPPNAVLQFPSDTHQFIPGSVHWAAATLPRMA